MKKHWLYPFFLLTSTMISVSGCAIDSASPEGAFGGIKVVNSSPKSYLKEAASSDGKDRYQYQLLAATSLLQNGDTNGAGQVLHKLSTTPLQGTQQSYFNILQAYYDTQMDEPRRGASRLNNGVGKISDLPTNLQILYYQVAYITFSRSNELSQSTVAEIKLADYQAKNLNSQDQLKLWAKVFRDLQNLSMSQLSIQTNHPDPLVRGWFSLASTSKQFANHPAPLVAGIKNWQRTYPSHPANLLIPNEPQLAAAKMPLEPNQIALLLPLSGPFASTGQAIRDGFMAAYNANNSIKPIVKSYDTAKSNVNDAYNEAIQNGANLVIGPVTKEEVSRLVSSGNISVPTITLNYTEKSPGSPNLIEFGLSSEQAAKQSAEIAWHHGTSRTLNLIQNTPWAQHVNDVFTSSFRAEGGVVLNTVSYQTQGELPNSVASLLGVTASEAQAKQISNLISRKVNYLPTRRQDANGFFVVAPPVAAREIQPLFHFYFAGTLPVYSVSLIYSGAQDSMNNQDINGTYFPDIPWLYNGTPYISQLRQTLQANGNYRPTLGRFYALGADAYLLGESFNRMTNMPSFALNGVTGQLYLDPNQTIYCQLATVQVQNGLVTLVNP